MKKKLLSVAIAAGMATAVTTAQAVYLNNDGLGQVLLYPYYTVEEGQDTYINLVNTTDETKAVKVRILEAMNSQEVLDFNLYLSPQDHWSAVITADPNGEGAIIRTADTSCTVPGSLASPAEGQTGADIAFRNFEYQSDSINNGVDRTREGYVEVIEMGVFFDSNASDTDAGEELEDAIEHVNGVPADCPAVVAAWNTNGAFEDNDVTLLPPSGGLYGYGVLINVAEGTDATYDAIALDAFTILPVHTDPGSLDPSLNGATPPIATVIDGDVAVVAPTSTGIDAVSALFMHDAIANDYVLEPTISAGTDWVITFPTKRDYVVGTLDTSGGLTDGETLATQPFTIVWDPVLTQACEPISIVYYDREERGQVPDDLDFSPLPPAAAPLSLCSEANVLTFNNSNVLNGSARVNKNLDVIFDNGWATIGFSAYNDMPNVTDGLGTPISVPLGNGYYGGRVLSTGGGFFQGLPVVGFAVQKYVNGDVGGVLSNYAGSVTHKSTRLIQ